LLAGRNAARLVRGAPLLTAPPATALGSLIAYVTHDERHEFQPMNVNYGLFPPLSHHLRGREKKAALAERALRDLATWQETQ
jgi:methylenetetrahydrofolate--tRNA-(uracil-5-)-methyltransferase